MNTLITLEAAIQLIKRGTPLSVAGTEATLDQLPSGNWIGGTIPYFMTASGGVTVTGGQVFVTDLSTVGTVRITSYAADELAGIAANAPDNGFSLTIMPAGGQAHKRFAEEAASYDGAFIKPTAGWIAGVHLNDIGKVSPKVYDGRTPTKHADRAVVAYVSLPDTKLASVEIVNPFEPGDGDVLHFAQTSFEVGDCEIKGKPVNLAEYVTQHELADGHLPLVGDFAGAHVNVSLQNVDVAAGKVTLYAPVFPGVDYRFAKPLKNYADTFRQRLTEVDQSGAVWSCNCVLNFLFGELEGKAIGGIEGPITFGEIAYQLLNQTLVVVRVL